jgi:hypothetical protein
MVGGVFTMAFINADITQELNPEVGVNNTFKSVKELPLGEPYFGYLKNIFLNTRSKYADGKETYVYVFANAVKDSQGYFVVAEDENGATKDTAFYGVSKLDNSFLQQLPNPSLAPEKYKGKNDPLYQKDWTAYQTLKAKMGLDPLAGLLPERPLGILTRIEYKGQSAAKADPTTGKIPVDSTGKTMMYTNVDCQVDPDQIDEDLNSMRAVLERREQVNQALGYGDTPQLEAPKTQKRAHTAVAPRQNVAISHARAPETKRAAASITQSFMEEGEDESFSSAPVTTYAPIKAAAFEKVTEITQELELDGIEEVEIKAPAAPVRRRTRPSNM